MTTGLRFGVRVELRGLMAWHEGDGGVARRADPALLSVRREDLLNCPTRLN